MPGTSVSNTQTPNGGAGHFRPRRSIPGVSNSSMDTWPGTAPRNPSSQTSLIGKQSSVPMAVFTRVGSCLAAHKARTSKVQQAGYVSTAKQARSEGVSAYLPQLITRERRTVTFITKPQPGYPVPLRSGARIKPIDKYSAAYRWYVLSYYKGVIQDYIKVI